MKRVFAAASIVFVAFSAIPVGAYGPKTSAMKEPVIRVAPPSPKFSDAERQTELAARRARVLEKMVDNSIMVLFSAEPRNYTNDVDFMYRQENNLYYLTALKQNGATLVISKSNGSTSETLFLPKRNPQFETWNGRMYSNEDARRLSGIGNIVDAAETKGYLDALKGKTEFTTKAGQRVPTGFEKLYLLLPAGDRDSNGLAEYRAEVSGQRGGGVQHADGQARVESAF
ncbi:MAG TPA: aminopeptidase P N-terminal domain-containing protein [Pyrinomonadaceae bacterium]|nr:aminopeptidase P N-terminal domain-containing protein [Pyrinomonadaceae bacterium]